MSNLWMTWSDINKKLEDRPLVYWGAGNRMQKTRRYVSREPEFCIDNNPYEQGTVEDGVKIVGPGALFSDWRPFYPFVVITTTGFLDVKKQLESYGLREGERFCVSPVLKDFSILDRMATHKARILFICSDPYNEKDKRGGLYSMEIPSGEFAQIRGGHCHGLAFSHSLCAIVLVNDTAGGIEIIRQWTLYPSVTRIELPKDARPHGVACEGGWIAVCYSGRDEVAQFLGGKLNATDTLSRKRYIFGQPEHHVNDCEISDGRLYVSMFSYSGNWKKDIFDGVIMERGLVGDPEWRPVMKNLSLPHTPRVIDGVLHFCESMEGKLYKGMNVLATFNGFIRGVDFDGEFYYVGQSQHRHITRRLGASNISLDTGIFMLDPVTKCTRFYPTPGLTDINAVMVSP